MKLDSAAI